MHKTQIKLWMQIVAVVLLAIFAGNLRAQTAATQKAGRCYALLIGGLPGSPVYTRRFQDWLRRFDAYLQTQNVAAADITVLSGDKNFKDPILSGGGVATRDTILAAIDAMSKRVRPEDQFVLVIIGHGSLSDSKPEFVLPGVDLDADSLGKAMAAIQADNQVVLNFSGTGGDFMKALAKRGRVNISATMSEENAEPVLAEFFLRGLESKRADGEGGPKDGSVTLLEAFNWASHQTALWICRQVGQKDGTWTVEGKESVEIFKKLFDGPEGEITPGGMRADGSRKLSGESDANKADEAVPLVVPRDIKPNTAEYWAGRRIVNEHAQLEDCGGESGVSALGGESGYTPIVAGKEGTEGDLAARVVLGRARLLGPGEKP